MPCFFDPRHGLSVDDVMWTERVHGTRTVPVCARDAALVGERQSPHTRTVQVGSRTLPYWDAGAPSEAYYRGWFGSSVPFLPGGPPSRTRGVDWQAVQLGEAEAARYFSPTAPGFGGGVGGNGGVGGGGS